MGFLSWLRNMTFFESRASILAKHRKELEARVSEQYGDLSKDNELLSKQVEQLRERLSTQEKLSSSFEQSVESVYASALAIDTGMYRPNLISLLHDFTERDREATEEIVAKVHEDGMGPMYLERFLQTLKDLGDSFKTPDADITILRKLLRSDYSVPEMRALSLYIFEDLSERTYDPGYEADLVHGKNGFRGKVYDDAISRYSRDSVHVDFVADLNQLEHDVLVRNAKSYANDWQMYRRELDQQIAHASNPPNTSAIMERVAVDKLVSYEKQNQIALIEYVVSQN